MTDWVAFNLYATFIAATVAAWLVAWKIENVKESKK